MAVGAVFIFSRPLPRVSEQWMGASSSSLYEAAGRLQVRAWKSWATTVEDTFAGSCSGKLASLPGVGHTTVAVDTRLLNLASLFHHVVGAENMAKDVIVRQTT